MSQEPSNPLRSWSGRLRSIGQRLTPATVLYLLNALLVYAVFFPRLSDLNAWDEAAMIASGPGLLQGGWPIFADNPLLALFYALTYLPFRSSPLWMVYSADLGRFLLFSLLWLGTAQVARHLSRFAPPVAMLGFLFVMPMSLEMLRFPSDPLFASLAALAFAQLIAYHNTRERRHAWLASLFVGLSALARNDGLVLFPILVILLLVLSLPSKDWWRTLLAGVVPFVALVGGYVLFCGLQTGNFRLGTMERTYDNFESGQAAVFHGTGQMNAVIEARLEARRVFGTPEENNYSVFRAIQRSPRVYAERLLVTIKALPRAVLHAYGIRFAVPVFLLALRGLVELLRRRELRLAACFLLWPAHLVTGFLITLFREGHLQFPYFVVLGLAAIGLARVLENIASRKEQLFFLISLVGFAAYGVVDRKIAVTYGAGVLLAALVVVGYVGRIRREMSALSPMMLLIVFCGGLVLRGGFPTPIVPGEGIDAKEQALEVLVESLEPGTPVAAGSPGVVWAAGMTYVGLAGGDVPVHRTPDGFLAWMVSQGIRAVYVDYSLFGENPAAWELIYANLHHGVERIYAGDEGDVQILVVQPEL